jgi:cell division protease FtsH
MIEDEVKRFIQEAYEMAFKIVTENEEEFERLAQGLLEYETLTGEEIKRVMRGEPPHAGEDEDDTPDAGNAPSVTAIPKTKPKAKPSGDGGMEPEMS